MREKIVGVRAETAVVEKRVKGDGVSCGESKKVIAFERASGESENV